MEDVGASVVLVVVEGVCCRSTSSSFCNSEVWSLSCSFSNTGFVSSSTGGSSVWIDFFLGSKFDSKFFLFCPVTGGAKVCCFGASGDCLSCTRNLDLFLSLESESGAGVGLVSCTVS